MRESLAPVAFALEKRIESEDRHDDKKSKGEFPRVGFGEFEEGLHWGDNSGRGGSSQLKRLWRGLPVCVLPVSYANPESFAKSKMEASATSEGAILNHWTIRVRFLILNNER